ncbi:hypothetical protein Q1695_003805 [Nippostrongylus brasiliensis]|nr:hypothetical protein Q1695_003805 [Nippostrongylus brasiliensis]
MVGLHIIWHVITGTLLLAVVLQSRFLFNVICCTPFLLTVAYHILKQKPAATVDKANFFSGLRMGGHRGSPYEAPENTVEGFEMAKLSKCDMVEFDLHFSADNVPVLMHDESTGRTSKEDVVVRNVTAHDIKNISLKIVSGIKAAIPTLSEAVDWCMKNNMKMVFDIKNAESKMIMTIANVIKSNNLYSRVIVSSFNPYVAYMVKRLDKNILTGFTSRASYYTYKDSDRTLRRHSGLQLLIDYILDDLVDLGIRSYILPQFLGVDMLLLHYKNVNTYLVDDARQQDIHVVAWTVNDPSIAASLRAINVPFLTDYPQLLKEKQ